MGLSSHVSSITMPWWQPEPILQECWENRHEKQNAADLPANYIGVSSLLPTVLGLTTRNSRIVGTQK